MMFFYKSDGYHGNRLPQFVGTLWSIWLLRNAQVFRQIRPMADSILRSIQKSDDQHATFSTDNNQQPMSGRDPMTPPEFLQVQLGHHYLEDRPLMIQIHVVWNKSNLATGMGWAVSSTLAHQTQQYGAFSYASSAIAATTMACLKAVTWARAGHSNIILLTSSTQFLQILKSRDYHDITIKWTIGALRQEGLSLPSCKVLRVCRTQITEAQQVALWCRQHSMDFG